MAAHFEPDGNDRAFEPHDDYVVVHLGKTGRNELFQQYCVEAGQKTTMLQHNRQ